MSQARILTQANESCVTLTPWSREVRTKLSQKTKCYVNQTSGKWKHLCGFLSQSLQTDFCQQHRHLTPHLLCLPFQPRASWWQKVHTVGLINNLGKCMVCGGPNEKLPPLIPTPQTTGRRNRQILCLSNPFTGARMMKG